MRVKNLCKELLVSQQQAVIQYMLVPFPVFPLATPFLKGKRRE